MFNKITVLFMSILFYPLYLLAEDSVDAVETIISKGATDPAAYALLAEKLGPNMFLVVLCFVAFFLLVVGICWIAYKIGCKLMDRLDKFLDVIQTATITNAKSLEKQTAASKSTCDNVSDIKDASHNLANAIQKIGKEIGADIEGDCEKMHEKLRTRPALQL